ncbi:Na+/H+ antiporter NhaA [Tepidiforma thermophila]|uniref:Na(+)/H(+) antiporter NhaA n=1 Tax=Tepidiforma thermophila (strain KCTC 52669 / CGMCC 1.13589 / G233) TaxID=2761530 RepID=A0A2A9HDP5_TEPT2|nr:Na+/H+ antiporter NhaA [Tepidiforma thermophila]PFG73271.1 sodium/proton antiporter, NhaA family [Tepidiforma thermophila]
MLRALDTFIGGQGRRFVVRRFVRPAQRFAAIEASGGIVLLLGALIALAWVNSPWEQSYHDLWETELALDLHLFKIEQHLGHAVNDGLMVLFFFVVGLEIKRELVSGELSSPRRAILPAAAALGGMLGPALIYTAFNIGTETAHGWGIPMATDIAFAVGVLTLLGRRVPAPLKVFLLALAVADDLGGIVVIAVFYTESLSFEALGWAALVLLVILVINRGGVSAIGPYVFLGVLFWAAMLKSGIHATIAGVILAMLTPSRPYYTDEDFDATLERLQTEYALARADGDHDRMQQALAQIEDLASGMESPLDRLEHRLAPWTAFVIVPIFAIANAGVAVSGEMLREAVSSPVTLGVALGLVLGKPIGIFLTSWVCVRLGLAQLPANTSFRQVLGAGMIAGIGFTVALFIAGLSFENPAHLDEAKVGILAASALAGVLGSAYLLLLPAPKSSDAGLEAARAASASHA